MGPLIHDAAGELGSVVYLDRGRCSASFPQRIQYPHHAQTRQRRVGLDPQGFSRVAIHQIQRSEFPPAGQFVMRVVHRPHFIRTRRKRQRHSRFGSKSLALPLLHRQPFLPVQPIHSLVVDSPPKRSVLGLLPAQENVQPPIAESRTLGCQLAQPSTQRAFVPFSSLITPAPAVHPDQPAGASLAEPCFFSHDTHRFSLRPRAYHFFVSTTFSASMSCACCAMIFFSRPFSSSTCRSCLVSFTSRHPYFACQWQNVASLIPTRRQRSFTGTPASASFNTPTICSSLKRLLFMALLLSRSYTRRS